MFKVIAFLAFIAILAHFMAIFWLNTILFKIMANIIYTICKIVEVVALLCICIVIFKGV